MILMLQLTKEQFPNIASSVGKPSFPTLIPCIRLLVFAFLTSVTRITDNMCVWNTSMLSCMHIKYATGKLLRHCVCSSLNVLLLNVIRHNIGDEDGVAHSSTFASYLFGSTWRSTCSLVKLDCPAWPYSSGQSTLFVRNMSSAAGGKGQQSP